MSNQPAWDLIQPCFPSRRGRNTSPFGCSSGPSIRNSRPSSTGLPPGSVAGSSPASAFSQEDAGETVSIADSRAASSTATACLHPILIGHEQALLIPRWSW